MEQCFGKTVFREGMDIVRAFFLYGFHNAVTGIEQKHNDYALTQMILKKDHRNCLKGLTNTVATLKCSFWHGSKTPVI